MTALLYIYNTMLMKKLIAVLSVLALTVLASCGKTEVVEEVTSTGTEMESTETTEVLEMEVVEEVTTEETTSTGETTTEEVVVEAM